MNQSLKKILIVEDEEPMLKALYDKFDREGFQVSTSRDGEEGLQMALKDHPDLILLDIIMPRMDGMTFLKKIRQDKWGKEVPVIMLTNLQDPQKATESMELGVRNFLVKADMSLDNVVLRVKEELKMK